MDKTDLIPIKLNGKNYLQWSFHLVNFVEGHGLLGILDGTDFMPESKEQGSASTADPTSKSADEKVLATWRQNNIKVVTWILNSVDSSISLSLQAFSRASDMWTRETVISPKQ